MSELELHSQTSDAEDTKNQHVPLNLLMHPADYARLEAAAAVAGGNMNAFCCLSLHRAASAVLGDEIEYRKLGKDTSVQPNMIDFRGRENLSGCNSISWLMPTLRTE